ncbi:signal transducer CD24 isoform X1 [Rhinopithecus roxellana]|uniref:signal transducer CD24 isoform X1 n=2 Tax=Rhinopithecus roxellana TaxID=61622 RepID=UPI0012376F89|nr:signal transducer CD24 isoform X1 [Rhinopithecus roxellana]
MRVALEFAAPLGSPGHILQSGWQRTCSRTSCCPAAAEARTFLLVPLARRAPHLACARPEPEVLQAPSIQRDAQRTDGGDMGRAMVARLGLGLLLLALLLPTQIYSAGVTSTPLSSTSSQNTSTTPNPANTTTKAVGGALQSTASLFVVSLSLLHLYC